MNPLIALQIIDRRTQLTLLFVLDLEREFRFCLIWSRYRSFIKNNAPDPCSAMVQYISPWWNYSIFSLFSCIIKPPVLTNLTTVCPSIKVDSCLPMLEQLRYGRLSMKRLYRGRRNVFRLSDTGAWNRRHTADTCSRY